MTDLVMMWWVAIILALQVAIAFKPHNEDSRVAAIGSAITCLVVMPPAIWFFYRFWDVLWGASS